MRAFFVLLTACLLILPVLAESNNELTDEEKALLEQFKDEEAREAFTLASVLFGKGGEETKAVRAMGFATLGIAGLLVLIAFVGFVWINRKYKVEETGELQQFSDEQGGFGRY